MVWFVSIVAVVPYAAPARQRAVITICLLQMCRHIQTDTVVDNPHREGVSARPLREITTVRVVNVCEVELFVTAGGKGVVCRDPAGSIPDKTSKGVAQQGHGTSDSD